MCSRDWGLDAAVCARMTAVDSVLVGWTVQSGQTAFLSLILLIRLPKMSDELATGVTGTIMLTFQYPRPMMTMFCIRKPTDGST